MSGDFTDDDVNHAAEAGFKAIRAYAKKRGVCWGCLSALTVPDMLYHIVKHLVADEKLPGYRELVNSALEQALAERNGDTVGNCH